MNIEVLKPELSKLGKADLVDVLQYCFELIKAKDQEGAVTPRWLKEESLKRSVEMKSGKVPTFSWEKVKNYVKSSKV